MILRMIKIHAEGRIIKIVAKNKEGKKVIVRVEDIYPYYYTDKIPQTYDVVKIEKGFKTIDGKEVFKVYLKHPGLVPKYRKEDDYEADVPYVQRFLIDTGIREFFEIPDNVPYEKGEYVVTTDQIKSCDENIISIDA